MQLVPVSSKKDHKEFIRFPVRLYKEAKHWIRPMDKDIEEVFDPAKNKSFRSGDCQRWLLIRNKEIIGRIAAFIIEKKTEQGPELSSGIGFFECIDDQQAANTLFDAGKLWLEERKATYMDGPINFGRRDRWWGLLNKGFELEPNYQCNYNFPYYQKLFENYGFKTYFEQYTFVRVIKDPVHPRLVYKSEMVAKDPDYRLVHFKMNEFDRFAKDIIEVYNKAWVNHEGVTTISLEQGKAIMKRLKSVMVEEFIWLAYYKDEPAAIFVNIPEVNQVLKYVNGKLNLLGKLKFLWYKSRIKHRKVLGIIFGVAPEHQGKGVDGAIIVAFANEANQNHPEYETIEMHGIGDFNRKMILVVKQVGGDIRKVHTTYRYLFDRTQVFERMKSI
ncbi:MAG: hypothetical protein ABF293_10325 [Flavobacteriaceae bacterium]